MTMMSGFIYLTSVSTTKMRHGIINVDKKKTTEKMVTDKRPSGTTNAKFEKHLVFRLTKIEKILNLTCRCRRMKVIFV